jgi:hypothetical protein
MRSRTGVADIGNERVGENEHSAAITAEGGLIGVISERIDGQAELALKSHVRRNSSEFTGHPQQTDVASVLRRRCETD